jgi:hypothetical protein
MFSFLTRFHRHKNLENAILEQAKEVSDLKLQLASIYGKLAVRARELKRKTKMDAEIEAIKRQVEGDVIAVFDEQGKLIDEEEE